MLQKSCKHSAIQINSRISLVCFQDAYGQQQQQIHQQRQQQQLSGPGYAGGNQQLSQQLAALLRLPVRPNQQQSNGRRQIQPSAAGSAGPAVGSLPLLASANVAPGWVAGRGGGGVAGAQAEHLLGAGGAAVSSQRHRCSWGLIYCRSLL